MRDVYAPIDDPASKRGVPTRFSVGCLFVKRWGVLSRGGPGHDGKWAAAAYPRKNLPASPVAVKTWSHVFRRADERHQSQHGTVGVLHVGRPEAEPPGGPWHSVPHGYNTVGAFDVHARHNAATLRARSGLTRAQKESAMLPPGPPFAIKNRGYRQAIFLEVRWLRARTEGIGFSTLPLSSPSAAWAERARSNPTTGYKNRRCLGVMRKTPNGSD